MNAETVNPQAQTAAAAEPAQTAEASLLDSIIEGSRVARTDTEHERARDLIGELVDQVVEGSVTVSQNLIASIEARIAQLDAALSEQLNEVIHAGQFQRLEASWRGLHYLVHQAETGTSLKLRVLNATKKDLLNDFKRAPEFDQSSLFKKIYEDEYGVFGGSPYTALLGDFEFGNLPEDMYLLEEVAHVAAAAHAPFLSAAAPQMFGWDSYTEMIGARDLAKIFDTVEYAKWRSFRLAEDSRYVGLALPHYLGRLPYGANTVPVEAFNFDEHVDGKHHDKYLWVNAAYPLATRLTDAFAKYGWCTAIRGVEGGGLVEDLPTHTFSTDEGDIALKCPTELAITDRREKEFAELGFIPLVHCKGTDYAAFFSTQSTQKPKKYDTDAANANARLSAGLQYILAISRFAHYLKAMMRDKIGSFMTRKEAEQFLNRWVNNYVLGTEEAGQEMKARYPLAEARIDVSEVAGKPGVYKAVAFLKPHYQLEELTVSLRLVAELPPPVQKA